MSRLIKRSKDERKKERLNTELLQSILQSNIDNVRRLIEEGANPNARCRSSNASAMHIAALRGQTDIITELLKAKANLEVRDNKGCQPIHLTSYAGYVSVLKLILNHSPELVNSVVKYEEVPIIIDELDSWDHNHADVTQLLPDIRSGSSPLHIASSLSRKQTTEFLLSVHADVNLKDSQGLTPFDVAGFKAVGYYNFLKHDRQNDGGPLADQQAIFDELYPNLRTAWDNTKNNSYTQRLASGRNSLAPSRKESLIEDTNVHIPLLYPSISLIEKPTQTEISEAEYNSTQESSSSTFDVIKMLVQFGAKVKDEINNENESESNNRMYNNPVTALHTAVMNNDLKLIDWLLEDCQCDHMLMTKNDEGDTPLHVAVKKRYFDALRNMISWLDLDTLNITNKNGMTALYLAVYDDWFQAVALLLEAGADIKIKTQDNDTVITLAVTKNNPKLLEELLSADEEEEEEEDVLVNFLDEPLLIAIDNLNLVCLKILLEYGANVNVNFDNTGTTPLLKAAAKRWKDGVESLLDFHADVKIKNAKMETVYHITAKLGDHPIMRKLLEHKDSYLVINEADVDSFTPLFRAIESGCLECVDELITKDAQVDKKLPYDINILHYATELFPKTEKIIDWICNQGFVSTYNLSLLINSYNEDGLTPLEMAAAKGWYKCVKAMLGAYPHIIINEKGTSAAHLAARYGYADTLELLIKYDSKCLNITNHKDWYPLHVAARSGHGNCVVMMLRYGANISSYVKIDNTKKSALDLIIDYVPNAKEKLIHLFNTYIIEVQGDEKSDEHCSIEIDYSLLLGISTKSENESRKNSLQRYFHRSSLIEHNQSSQMTFTKTLLNSNNETLKETLLLHPLIETFLYFKWNNLKYFFIMILLCHILYSVGLITFALLNYVWNISVANWFLRPFMLFMLLPLGITEIIHAKALPYYYFLDIESWMKIFMLLIGTIVACMSSALDASRYLVSLSVLISWTVLLFLLARFHTWGLHVLMFQKVSYNVFEVLSRFIFLFVGFLFAFMIHFEGDAPFGNFWEALCKVLIMLVELDYSGVFHEGGEINTHTFVGRLMFVAFALLVAMVMVNLIVGMSVSDITQLEMQGRSEQLAKQTSFLVSLELLVYNDWLVKCIPNCLQTQVNKYRKIEAKKIVHPDDPRCPFTSQCKDALLRHGSVDHVPSIEHCLNQIEQLSNKIDTIKENLDKMMNILIINNPENNELYT